jgi:hypothetical protein
MHDIGKPAVTLSCVTLQDLSPVFILIASSLRASHHLLICPHHMFYLA